MIRLLVICLVLCVPLIGSAQETLLIVRQEGDDGAFETIADALDEIPRDMEGHYVIEIRDNETYEEKVEVNVRSSIDATLTIRAGAGNTPAIVSDKNKNPALKISSPFVTIDGLVLLGGERSSGLHIDWADDVTIRNCDIRGAEERDTPGLYIQGARRALISDNTIRQNDIGILVYDAEDGGTTIRNNRIFDNSKRGIWIYKGTANTTVVNNTLYHNTIEVELGDDGNKKSDPGTGNVFRNNIIVAHEDDGYCIVISSGDGDDDQNNRNDDDDDDGRRNNGDNNNNNDGDDDGDVLGGSSFDYNLYQTEDRGTHVARLQGRDLNDLADWQSRTGADAHSLATDPLLVSPVSDLHPQSTTGSFHGGAWTADANDSPAIDAGDPNDTFANETDPNGGRINIGAWGNTPQASRTMGTAVPVPIGAFASAAQSADGTGNVAVSVEVNHSTGGDTQARIEWSDAETGTYRAATLAGPVTADADDSGGPPGLDNGAAYQLGAGGDTRIVTADGSNTVSFTWASASDVPAADGTHWLRLIVSDGATDQATPALQQVAVDNVAPAGLADLTDTDLSGTSLTFSWTAAMESNFDGYDLWYGPDQGDVEGRTGAASVWTDEQDEALATVSTSTTTVTGLARGTQYFAKLWATDTAGHEVGSSLRSSFTAGRDTVFHYVATTGINNGTEGDRSDPWSTIQRAINAIPGNLVNQETYYVVEVLDSGRYEGKVTINRKTNQSYSITVRPAAGQTPTIVPPNNKDAVLIKTAYATLTGFRIEVPEKVGIIVDGEDGVSLLNLVIDGSGNTAGIRLEKADFTRVHNVRINDADVGIHLGDDADNNGFRNVALLGDGSRAIGVYFDQETDADSLVNLSIVGFQQGLAFRGGKKAAGDGHVMRNCIIHDVGTAVVVDKALGSTFRLLDYNDLHPVDGGHVGSIEGADFTTLTAWKNESGLDEHSMSLDPLFVADDVAPASMDLHVASQAGRWDGSGFVSDAQTSPTIDAGHPRDSFDNETTPNGNRINLGTWGNTAEASRSGGVSLVQGGLPWSTYLMAGVPVTPRDPDPHAVLSDDFPGENGENIWGEWVRLVRWDTAQEDYVYYEEDEGAAGAPPDFLPGRGYWLIQWWSIIDANGNSSGDSVTVDGALAPSTQDYVIPLQVAGTNGFNQLANPFVFDIDWANTRVRDVASGRELSIAEAAEREVIDGHAYLWDWEEQVYLPIDAEDGGRIGSWGGFWVDQLVTDRRLELLIPAVEATESLSKTLQVRASPTDWFVEFSVEGVAQVTTESGTFNVPVHDLNNRAGVHEDASRRWDPLDALDLTGLRQPYLYVYFPHGDEADPQTYWPDRPNRYTYDLRDPDWLEQVWEFVVDTQALDTELTWIWTNPGGIPVGYHVALEDADADTVIRPDISQSPTHRFSSGSQGMRRFRLHALYEDIVGDVGGDRSVTPDDARRVLRHVVGSQVLPEFALEQARVRDGGSGADVTPLDAAWILRYAEGRVATLPVPAADLHGAAPAGKALHLSAPVAQRDGNWTFPIYLDDAAGLLSGTLQLTWDTQHLALVDIEPGQNLIRFEGTFVSTAEGTAVYAFAGGTTPEGRQILANVKMQSLSPGADLSEHVAIASAELNDGQTAAKVLAPRPEELLLYPAAPNPFNGSVSLRFGLPQAGAAQLSIYNVLGQRVRTLADSEFAAGLYRMIWDGRDAAGHDVASGVYLAQLVAGDRKMVQMLALVR